MTIPISRRIVALIKNLTYGLLVFTAFTKLVPVDYITIKFGALGIGGFSRILGLIQLTAVLIYFSPKMHGLGFALLCAYFGGAVATDLQHPEYLPQPLFMLSLIFINTFMTDPSYFGKCFSADHRVCCTVVKLNFRPA
jgi:hypothetical protein